MFRTVVNLFLLLSALHAAMSTISPSTTEFFPEINGNLTKIIWAHAVNSQQELQEALNSSTVMMLEADIVMGTLNTTNSTEEIPIMGHPPAIESDISLEEFLNSVLMDGKRGVKLDFKTIEVFNQSKPLLASLRPNMTFPVWINADILAGPVNATGTPVDAESFLTGALETFPESTLSIGWTTRYGTEYNITEGTYSTEQVEEMISTIQRINVSMPITYPVRAGIAANSLSAMETLVSKTTANNSTLTIWSSNGDSVDTDKLSTLINMIGVDKVYVDVPTEVWEELNLSSGASRLSMGAMTVGVVLGGLTLMKML